MERCLYYPNYVNHYYYEEGTKTILLKRHNGHAWVFTNYLEFDTTDEAEDYFNNKCGA